MKRAGKACLTCRSRKIRCNLEENGPPCSNCLTDQADCQTARSKRGRKPRPRLKPQAQDASENAEAGLVDGARAIASPPQSRFSATHTEGWLDNGADVDMFSLAPYPGVCVCALATLNLNVFSMADRLCHQPPPPNTLLLRLTPNSCTKN